ncbi:hypothetical protein PSAC2689_10599 [Paraburkholderia sacchari]
MRRGRTVEASKSRIQRYAFMRGMNDFDGFGTKATEASRPEPMGWNISRRQPFITCRAQGGTASCRSAPLAAFILRGRAVMPRAAPIKGVKT